jgi:hypothetical protein
MVASLPQPAPTPTPAGARACRAQDAREVREGSWGNSSPSERTFSRGQWDREGKKASNSRASPCGSSTERTPLAAAVGLTCVEAYARVPWAARLLYSALGGSGCSGTDLAFRLRVSSVKEIPG